MKKILVTLAIALIGSLTMTTVEAADITVAASDDLSQKIEGAASGDILLLEEGTYIGNITIDKDLTIKGENKETTIIEGQITVKNNLNLEGVTVVGKYVDNTYRNVVTITVPDLTVDITNCILNVEGYVDGEDYKTGVAGVRVDRGSDSTQLTIKDTEINSTYGVFVKSASNNINIDNSEINGWAALELSSNEGDINSLNEVLITNSVLTGTTYHPVIADNGNYYGVISIGSQKQLTLAFDNTTIQNKVITDNRQDLILYNDYYEDNEETTVLLSNCKLINNDENGESSVVNYGSEENAIGGNMLIVTPDTIITSKNDKNIELVGENVLLTLSTTDGDVILSVPKGTVITEDILDSQQMEIEGYIFGGWYTNDDYTDEFLADTEINEDTVIYAKYTLIESNENTNEEETQEENPQTGDLSLGLMMFILSFALVGGLYATYKIRLLKSRV